MNYCTETSFLTLIKVSGKDAQVFLQKQFINDLNQITTGHFQLNAWCNHKGRVISNFLLACLDDNWWLLLPKELAEEVLLRLKIFILQSDCTLELLPPAKIIGCYGADLLNKVRYNFNLDKTKPGDLIGIEKIFFWHLQDNEGIPHSLLVSFDEKIPKWLDKDMIENDGKWALFEVKRKMPWITKATKESILPQSLNFDQMNGMSLSKGCYPGQEIIARLHYRGTVKHRLQTFIVKQVVQQAVDLLPGQRIVATGQNIGTTINAATDDKSTFLLAVCPTSLPTNLMLAKLDLPILPL